jgi:methyltransferase (TIGR00027 family)
VDEVSETALITLRSRITESRSAKPVISDPVGIYCFEQLMDKVPVELRRRILNRKLSPVLTRHIALRARKYDHLCREFIEEYPDCLIVSLGCGFDTRFWRLGIPGLNYIELDLPEVIQTKKEILGDRITYKMIGASVLDESWISSVRHMDHGHVLFIAEGLFMYLPGDRVRVTLGRIADNFKGSRIVVEVVAERYTRGFRKKMVERKMKRNAGTKAGESYQFGLRHARDLESFHPGFRVKEEWSYFEDPDITPRFLRHFRHIRSLSKTQYTVIAGIGH